MDYAHLFTSFDGRISRKPYWLAVIVLVVISIVAMVGLSLMGLEMQSRGFMIATLIIQLVFLYPSIALMVKRLHDRNRPGWWAAFMLVPVILQGVTNALGITGVDPSNPSALDYLFLAVTFIVGVWFFIELGCLRGTVGPNQYGPDPLGGDVVVAPR